MRVSRMKYDRKIKEKNRIKTILIIKEDMYCVGVCVWWLIYIYIYIIILKMMGSCYVYRLCLVKKKKLKVREYNI